MEEVIRTFNITAESEKATHLSAIFLIFTKYITDSKVEAQTAINCFKVFEVISDNLISVQLGSHYNGKEALHPLEPILLNLFPVIVRIASHFDSLVNRLSIRGTYLFGMLFRISYENRSDALARVTTALN